MSASRPGGVIAAIPTPVSGLEPDLDRFVALALHLLATGCDGLNVLGTTGEATSFSLEQRLRVMEAAARTGLPMGRLMVGTGAAAVGDAVVLTGQAAALGFGGALVLPPFYYKNVPADGVVRYIGTIVEATKESAIPIYLYNFPAQSGVAYDLTLIARLIEEFGSRIAGLKDSSGDVAYAREAAAAAPGFDVFPSTEAALGEARDGPFAGCISATANVNSQWCAKAFHDRDDAALATAVKIRALFDGKPLVPGVKALLAELHDDPALADVMPPFARLDEATADDIHAAFQTIAEAAGG